MSKYQDYSLGEIVHKMVISIKATRTILKKKKYKCYSICKVHHLNERDFRRAVLCELVKKLKWGKVKNIKNTK